MHLFSKTMPLPIVRGVIAMTLLAILIVACSESISISEHKKQAAATTINNIKMDTIPKIMNGFDLNNASIPINEIHQGGPPKDGIPAIDKPKFINAEAVDFLSHDDEVLGISMNGVTKIYPIKIMNYHEVVNDKFGDRSVIITFCPLCGSGVAFDGNIDGKEYTFGVSGLLYNSDVLLYDRQTESLWSQLIGKSIAGKSLDKNITIVLMEHTTWGDWKTRYPKSEILDTDTGFSRDYNRLPYVGYEDAEQLYFPVNHSNDVLSNKEKVIGISIDGVHKAYPFSELENELVKDVLNGQNITIHYNKKSDSAYIKNENGDLMPTVTLFWFAWSAFHPDTLLFSKK